MVMLRHKTTNWNRERAKFAGGVAFFPSTRVHGFASKTEALAREIPPAAQAIKAATSRFAHLEKFSLNVSSSWFVIRVNFLHP